jgi:hypothetical protein
MEAKKAKKAQGKKSLVSKLYGKVEKELKSALSIAKNVFNKALGKLDNAVAFGGNDDDAKRITNTILKAMDKVAMKAPIVGCFRPLVKGALEFTEPKMRSLLSKVNTLFKSKLEQLAQKALAYGFGKALPKLLSTISGGNGRYMDYSIYKARLVVGQLILSAMKKREELLTALRKKVATLSGKELSGNNGKYMEKSVYDLRRMSKMKFDLMSILTQGFCLLQGLLARKISEVLRVWLPKVWDAVMNVAGGWMIGMTSVGINIVAASGSAFTEWLSAGSSAAVQQVWEKLASAGKNAFMSTMDWIIQKLVAKLVAKIMGKLPAGAAVNKVVAIDERAKSFIKDKQAAVAKIFSFIPENIRSLFAKAIKNYFNIVVQSLIQDARQKERLDASLAGFVPELHGQTNPPKFGEIVRSVDKANAKVRILTARKEAGERNGEEITKEAPPPPKPKGKPQNFRV